MSIQHTYFLTEAEARLEYEKAQMVDYPNGQQLRQFCYFNSDKSAPIVHPETPYLVNLPVKFFSEFFKLFLAYPIVEKVAMPEGIDEETKQQLLEDLDAVIGEVKALREKYINDALFTQPVMAEWMAIQGHQIYTLNPYIAATQVCYYIGEPLQTDNPPKNLVALSLDHLLEDILEENKRQPCVLITSPFDNGQLIEQGESILEAISKNLDNFKASKVQAFYQQRLKEPDVDFLEKPYRIFMTISRYTRVMRYAFEGLADAFKALGCEVYMIRDDEYSAAMAYDDMLGMKAYNPHIVININHLFNSFLHPSVFNVVWWQDAMEELEVEDGLFPIRDRDLFYAFGHVQMDLMKKKSDRVEYQEQCASQAIYHLPEEPTERREVMAFVGDAYWKDAQKLKDNLLEAQFLEVEQDFLTLFHQGQVKGADNIDDLIQTYESFATSPLRLSRFWIYITRREVVYHIINHANIPIELYGPGWDQDPKTAPFFKGMITPGKDLAKLYQSVKYGLSMQPYMIGHQRLAEIKFCGAIPVTYCSQNKYEKIDYWDEMISFKHLDDLIEQLNSGKTVQNHHKIEAHFTYTAFAKRILERVEKKLEQDGTPH